MPLCHEQNISHFFEQIRLGLARALSQSTAGRGHSHSHSTSQSVDKALFHTSVVVSVGFTPCPHAAKQNPGGRDDGPEGGRVLWVLFAFLVVLVVEDARMDVHVQDPHPQGEPETQGVDVVFESRVAILHAAGPEDHQEQGEVPTECSDVRSFPGHCHGHWGEAKT